MNLKSAASAWVGRQIERAVVAAIHRGYVAPVQPGMIGQRITIPSSLTDLADGYGLIPAVFAGVSRVSNTAAQVPVAVYRRRKGSDEAIADHPLAEMLHPITGRFNPWLTSVEAWQTIFSQMCLVGNAYVLKDVTQFGGQPGELSVLRPEWVSIVPGRDRPVAEYGYGMMGSGGGATYKPEEIVPLSFFNPAHPFVGQAPLLAAKRNMLLHLYMVEFNRTFFQNGATLGGVINMKVSGTKEKAQALLERFNARHSGLDENGRPKTHKWEVVTGAEEIVEFGKSLKDIQFDQGLQRCMQQILMVLGVPPVVIGSMDGATYANADQQVKQFVQGTIQPLCMLRDARLNLHLVPDFGRDLYVASDFSNVEALLPGWEIVRATIDTALAKRLITRNEARQWLRTRRIPELAPLPDGDEYWRPEAQPIVDPASAPGDAVPAEDQVAKAIDDAVSAHRRRELTSLRAQMRKKERTRDERVNAQWPKLSKALRQNLSEQRLKLIEAPIDPLSDFSVVDLIVGATQTASSERFAEAMKSIVAKFGGQITDDLNVDGLSFNAISENVVRYTVHSGAEKVKEINGGTAKVTKAAIKDALLKAHLAGENIVEAGSRIIQETINESFDDMSRERASHIAQTETTSAYNFSDHEAWDQSGVVDGKIWGTQKDGKVRSIDNGDEFDHSVMEGVQVAMEDPFEVPRKEGAPERIMYPGDPTGSAGNIIEDRCFMLPVLSTRHLVNRLRSRVEDTRSHIAAIPLNGSGRKLRK